MEYRHRPPLRWTCVASFVAAALLALPGPERHAAGAPASTPRKAPADSNEQVALELFEQSEHLYQQGRFADAAALLEQAYALHSEPTLLYNLARAREGEGNLAEAADAYEQYLKGNPEAADRGAIEHRIRTLREQDAKQQALEADRQAAEAKLRELQQRSDGQPSADGSEDGSLLAGPLPWVIFGVGAAGVGAGVVVGLLAQNKHQDAVDEPVQADAQQLQDGAESLALGATIAYVAGGTLAAAGAILGIVGLVGASEEEPSDSTGTPASAGEPRSADLSVRWTVGPGSFTLTGRF